MFNTIYEDSKEPLIVYTRDEINDLRKKSEELARTRFRTLDESVNVVYHPGMLLAESDSEGASNV